MGFSLRWLLLQNTGSRACGLSSCGLWDLECAAQLQLPWSMRDLPRPRIEPVPLVLAGGYLTSRPPGKSGSYFPYSSGLPSWSPLCFGGPKPPVFFERVILAPTSQPPAWPYWPVAVKEITDRRKCEAFHEIKDKICVLQDWGQRWNLGEI